MSRNAAAAGKSHRTWSKNPSRARGDPLGALHRVALRDDPAALALRGIATAQCDRKIHQFDPDTGAVLRTIESDRFVTGVTWVDGELWHGAWEGESEIRQVDRGTGEVLARLIMPGGAPLRGRQTGPQVTAPSRRGAGARAERRSCDFHGWLARVG